MITGNDKYTFKLSGSDVPQERSFAFFLPVSFIGAFIMLRFAPVQPEKKYRGLTLATLGEPVAAKETFEV